MTEENPWVRFGNAVRFAREELEVGYRQMAGEAGIAEMTWWRAEKGNAVTPRTVAKIEKALGWPKGTADAIIYEGQDTEDRLAALEHRIAALDAAVQKLLRQASAAASREARRGRGGSSSRS